MDEESYGAVGAVSGNLSLNIIIRLIFDLKIYKIQSH
jgi:hypothetical protein